LVGVFVKVLVEVLVAVRVKVLVPAGVKVKVGVLAAVTMTVPTIPVQLAAQEVVPQAEWMEQ